MATFYEPVVINSAVTLTVGTIVADKVELSATKQGILLATGGTDAGQAPLKFQTGSVLTTPEVGAIEFSGTEFFATVNVSSTPTRRYMLLSDHGNGTAPVLAGASPEAGDYWGTSGNSLLATPDKWIRVIINGQPYVFPAYIPGE